MPRSPASSCLPPGWPRAHHPPPWGPSRGGPSSVKKDGSQGHRRGFCGSLAHETLDMCHSQMTPGRLAAQMHDGPFRVPP